MRRFFHHLYHHFMTITRHRHLVMKHCNKAGIPLRGLFHDLSKYSFAEFFMGVKYYNDGKKSPNEKERGERGFSSAWMHHKGRNKHHFEYWTDYYEGKIMPVPMPLIYRKELLCDRIAASKIYQGRQYTDQHPLTYFLNGKKNRLIDPETSDFIEYFLSLLANEGEEKMFEELRNIKSL